MIVIGYVASIIDAVGVRACDTSISMESTARKVDVRIVFVVLEIVLLSGVAISFVQIVFFFSFWLLYMYVDIQVIALIIKIALLVVVQFLQF